MRALQRWLLVGLLASASTVQAQGEAAAAPSDSAALLTPAEVVDRFHAALREGETDRALALLTNDLLIYETGFVERGKARYGGGRLLEDEQFAQKTTRKILQRDQWQEGDAAGVNSFVDIRGEYGGRKLALEQAETMLLQRGAEGWRIRHIHWSAHSVDP